VFRCSLHPSLARGIPLSLLWPRPMLPTDRAQASAMQSLPKPDLHYRGHHFRIHQTAPDRLVPGDLPPDAEQEGGFCDVSPPAVGYFLQRGLADEAQAHAGHGERDADQPLSGFIEVDDAYLGGERSGGKRGRGAAAKTPFVAAVETTREGRPTRIKLSVVRGFSNDEILAWSQQHLTPGSVVISDGLQCFRAVTDAGCAHDRLVCGGGRASVEEPEFYWVNTVLGNLKSALRSAYHAVRPKYSQRYLAEFQYRFNRRFDLCSLIGRLASAALSVPPMPVRLLKIGLT
jgi:hypothetical protein